MVIFVDVNLREIHIYSDTGIRKIPFHDAHTLTTIIGNQKINYITNIIETTAGEIVNLVRGISGQKPIARTQRNIVPDLEIAKEATYLHSTSKGTLLIPDMDDKPAPGQKGYIRKSLIRFEGSGDCKLFDDDMKEKIKKSPMLRTLIKKGTIEIIGEQQKTEFLKQWRGELKKRAVQQSARDAALDAIIMDERVGDGNWNGEIAGDSTIIEIDVGRRGIGGGGESHGATSMSELQAMIDGTM